MLRLKRVYEPPAKADGHRILVDRLWPRGLSKKTAAVDEWLKEIAPSTELRRWFQHDPKKWPEFQKRYRRELRAHNAVLREIVDRATRHTVTLLYGARDESHNDAVVLAAVLRRRLRRARAGRRAA
jgi:uncharacterized protein YeaO (DUF488 family)